VKVLKTSTIQLLRFHFSLFLLPVFLFALSEIQHPPFGRIILVFIVLHLLVYPSSNGYNSYMDRDESPIGGLANPLQPTRQLFIVTVIMDLIALIVSFFISSVFSVGILIYILASRAYSYRRIRLKRFPVTGFLVVFICQGALIFIITTLAITGSFQKFTWLDAGISSLLIGALYPLTQIYQHEEDKKDGVISLSYQLGKRGTFIFSMVLFLFATFLLFIRFKEVNQLRYFLLFTIVMLPVLIYFLVWQFRVGKNVAAANFSNSLKMNVISTICTTIYFSILIWIH